MVALGVAFLMAFGATFFALTVFLAADLTTFLRLLSLR